MFIILLKFSTNKENVKDFMKAHGDWLQRGFDEGVFILAGRILPEEGGSILAHNISRDALTRLINEDPFVKNNVVVAEILETLPAIAEDRLKFLLRK